MLLLTSRPLGGKVNHLPATRSSQSIINPQYTKARLSLLINKSNNAAQENNNNNNNNSPSILKNLFYPRRSFHSSYTPYATAPASKKGAPAEASGEAAAATTTEGEPKEKKKKLTKGNVIIAVIVITTKIQTFVWSYRYIIKRRTHLLICITTKPIGAEILAGMTEEKWKEVEERLNREMLESGLGGLGYIPDRL